MGTVREFLKKWTGKVSGVITYILLLIFFGVLLVLSFLGFINIIKDLDANPEKFFSFIGLSFTLAFLCYQAAENLKEHKLFFVKLAEHFTLTTILFFTGFISIGGFNNLSKGVSSGAYQIMKMIFGPVIGVTLLISVVVFMFSLFRLLLFHAGWMEQIKRGIEQLKEVIGL